MKTKFDRLAEGLLKPINPNASIILGFLTMFWGIWLLLPHDVFERAPLYFRMWQIAPEWAWGGWATICGFMIIVSIIKSNWKMMTKAMGFASWHWCTVAGMMWWGDWQNTGGLTYSFISLYAIYVFLNVKINYVKFPDK